MTQVFISYSRKDLAFVKRLAKDLEDAGLEVWYDLSGLEVGQRWGSEIQKAIRKSHYFMAVMSPNSVDSEWVEREFLYSSNLKLKVIPLLYKACDLPMWCLNLHYIDIQGRNYKRHFPDILKAMNINPGEAAKGMEPAVVPIAVQELQEIQEPLPPVVKPEEQKPTPLQTKPLAGQEPAEEGKALQPKMLPREKRTRPRREVKVRVAWIIAPVAALVIMTVITLLVLRADGRLVPTKPYVSPVPTKAPVPTETQAATITPVPTRAPQPTDTPVPPATLTTPTPSPTPGIGSRWTSPVDNMVMVYVPEGDFSMGSVSDRFNEQPVHTVYLDAFWIDQTEVTNHMYALCVAQGACSRPPENSNSYHFSGITYSFFGHYGNPLYDNHPVNNLNWDMAEAYCRWAGRRLPTEAEWEKAARGTDGRIYPWGNTFPTCQLANLYSFGVNKTGCVDTTMVVGSYPAGASPYGALDMAGNAWEWVNDWYSATYYIHSPGSNPTGPAKGDYHVMRGISWGANVDVARSACRFGGNPADYAPNVPGFRCARSAQ